MGEQKKGDLGNIRVHKFKYQRQEYLAAYRYSPENSFEPVEIMLRNVHEIISAPARQTCQVFKT
ncbi:type II toxin-antitoxin system RelE/ParE family toxin [Methylovulum sp.]|uniref:type II toxin-antitoxin system RelE/ParE family toxin n=1 Tax=Methylovulum sp. TaxID=1916980 RepID=UPI003454E840